MSNEQSIKETLDVIRRALEDDNSSDNQNDIFLLNMITLIILAPICLSP